MLGDELKKHRQRMGLTQVELARALGVNQGTLSRWERGEVSVPVEKLKTIRKELNLSFSDLAKIALKQDETSPPLTTGHVRSKDDLVAWHNKLIDSGIDDPNFLLVMMVIQRDLDQESWVVSTTIPELAARAALSTRMVEQVWDKVLASPFIERVGTGEWVLRLVFPEEG